MKDKWKQLIFRCAGHFYIIRFNPNDGPAGVSAALQSWVDNPELDFSEDDRTRLFDVLKCVYAAYGP